MHVVGVHAGELDDDGQPRRVVAAHAVGAWMEAATKAREARYLPQLREQLLDLSAQALVVALRHARERTPA